MASLDYFEWIDAQAGTPNDIGFGCQDERDLPLEPCPLQIGDTVVPAFQPDDDCTDDEWERQADEHTRSMVNAGALMAPEVDSFMFRGRPVTNIEMYALVLAHRDNELRVNAEFARQLLLLIEKGSL